MASAQEEQRTAVIFPGISPCRFADVGRFLVINPVARRLTTVADETLGYSLVDQFREATGDYTEYERVAFLVVCLSLAFWAQENMELTADVCAGPSFGGGPAAVYSGALDLPEAITMTARWGHYLDDYFATSHSDVVTQSFARVPETVLAEIMAELDAAGEWHDVACRVDVDFHMVSVREHMLEWLHTRLRSAGGLPLYTMRPPMHSRAFASLRATIEAELFPGLHFRDPRIPVISDHDGKELTTGDEIRALLLDGVVTMVDWPAAVAALRDKGVRKAYVSGPDGLWGRVACARTSFEVMPLTPGLALRPRATARPAWSRSAVERVR